MISDILQKAVESNGLSKNEIISLLTIDKQDDLDLLYKTGRNIRSSVWQDDIFLYGFIYFSTYCRNNCNFCYFRRTNLIDRYRKKPEEIIRVAENLKQSGIHLIDLTMGEDQLYHSEDFRPVIEIIREIKRLTALPVMISPGVVSKDVVDNFADIDVDWYALYQETHNRKLFRKLRIEQNYDERMDIKLYARNKGLLVEEGIMTGIGETIDDLAYSILIMGQTGAKQLRVMSFIPQKGSPMEHCLTPDRSFEMKIIAILRILYPWALIPASLDVDGIDGLRDRLNAGANVVTSIIPPNSGLSGVAQNSLDIEDGCRTVKGVKTILEEMNLNPASAVDYKKILKKFKNGYPKISTYGRSDRI